MRCLNIQGFNELLVWIFIPTINFYLWYSISINKSNKCNQYKKNLLSNCCKNNDFIDNFDEISITLVNSKEFDKIRNERLADVPYVEKKNSIILNHKSSSECSRYVYGLSGVVASKFCFGVIYVKNSYNYTYNLIRIDSNIDESGELKQDPKYAYAIDKSLIQIDFNMTDDEENSNKSKAKTKKIYPLVLNEFNKNRLRATGFFREPPEENGRERIRQKMQPFIENFDDMNTEINLKLSDSGFNRGDDLIVMVVNQGEIDLFLNFACSCQQHDISLFNVIVFSGSSEIIDIIESTGAMALYHIGYGVVSKKASNDYLDRTFVDMMWYKAFSVYLILRLGYNILFQDVDLVWFKNPIPYFYNYLLNDTIRSNLTNYPIEGFFSDDGQRTHRYTPYFANSGFYYIKSNERSIYFTWSIMTAFDIVQVTGSHQNVFTMRLLEGLGLNYTQIKLLSLDDFPTGMTYHHNKKYMKKFYQREVSPYNFHMCWTQGKTDKLINFKKSLMWYITETCTNLKDLIPPKGNIYTTIKSNKESLLDMNDHNNFSMYLLKTCCYRSEGSM